MSTIRPIGSLRGTISAIGRLTGKLTPSTNLLSATLSCPDGRIPQSKTVSPTNEEQVVTYGHGYNCLDRVVVSPIPCTRTPNEAGGITFSIGEK